MIFRVVPRSFVGGAGLSSCLLAKGICFASGIVGGVTALGAMVGVVVGRGIELARVHSGSRA